VTTWIVEVRVSGRLSATSAARMRRRLASCQPTLSVEEDSWSARVQVDTVDTVDAFRAVSQALELLDVSGPVVRVEAMTAEEAERQLASPTLPDLVGILDIQELAGLRTKQRAHQVTELPGFPPPALATRAGRLWVRAAVERFLRQWPRRPGRPPKTFPPASEPELDGAGSQPN
jgi:hypothetical protein